MTDAQIRQQVLSRFSPAMDRAEIPALLHTLASLALHRDAHAADAMLAGDAGRQDRAEVEATMGALEASWAEEVVVLRAEVARQQGIAAQTRLGSAAVVALLQAAPLLHEDLVTEALETGAVAPQRRPSGVRRGRGSAPSRSCPHAPRR